MIIETSANRLYRVFETGDVALSHCWYGVEVKKVRRQYVTKGRISHPRPQLVRKAGCRVIEADGAEAVKYGVQSDDSFKAEG